MLEYDRKFTILSVMLSVIVDLFRSTIEQSSEGQGAFINPPMQNWIRLDLINPIGLSVPYGGSMLNTSAGMHRQV